MMRHRPCGCDARDTIDYDQGALPSSQLCSACAVTPCAYVAQFGCIIEHNGICLAGESGGFEGAVEGDVWAAGDVTLRVLCEFQTPCVFVSLQDATGVGGTCSPTTSCHQDICCTGTQDVTHNGQPCVGCTNPGACQWIHRLGSIDGLNTGWSMDISADPVLLTHTAAGVTYQANAAWECLGKNTMTLTEPFDGPLPSKVCVIPKPFRDGDGLALPFKCSNVGIVEQNCCDDAIPCGYDDADRLPCCDPCCDELPDQPLFITCGECSESTTVTPTVGGGNGLDGVSSPSGQTYGACATLCGKELCGNWYCSSGQWKLDGYIDGEFCGTGDLDHECCPLSLGTTTLSGCSPSGCDVCVGPDCGVPTDCCPDDDIPTTLTASFGPNTETPGCDEGTAEGTSLSLVYDSANDWWDGSATTDTGNLGFRIWCDAGTWMGEPRCNGSAANSPSPLTLVSCNPFEATATATFGASCGGCHDGATEITQTYLITITA